MSRTEAWAKPFLTISSRAASINRLRVRAWLSSRFNLGTMRLSAFKITIDFQISCDICNPNRPPQRLRRNRNSR
jgi:hypothetical protein